MSEPDPAMDALMRRYVAETNASARDAIVREMTALISARLTIARIKPPEPPPDRRYGISFTEAGKK